jgi:hypothetical protein
MIFIVEKILKIHAIVTQNVDATSILVEEVFAHLLQHNANHQLIQLPSELAQMDIITVALIVHSKIEYFAKLLDKFAKALKALLIFTITKHVTNSSLLIALITLTTLDVVLERPVLSFIKIVSQMVDLVPTPLAMDFTIAEMEFAEPTYTPLVLLDQHAQLRSIVVTEYVLLTHFNVNHQLHLHQVVSVPME